MTGILFGTGIGPGDPELMTLKAVRLIRENDTIAVPGEKPEESIAYQIAVQAVPELAEKELVAIPMPMTKNAKELEENHRRGAEKIEEAAGCRKKRSISDTRRSNRVFYLPLCTQMGTGRRLRCENCKRCYIVLRGSSISFRGTGGKFRRTACDSGVLSD